MATKQFEVHCKIINYVEKQDPALADLLKNTCTDLSLNNLKGKNGITFLMPKKEYVDEIAKLAYSPKVEDVDKASDMLNALVIFDLFKSPSEWIEKKDDIPNALRQRVEVDSVSGKTVKFKSGATAVIDEKFKTQGKGPNKEAKLAVWTLDGKIPVTTDKPTAFKYSKKVKKGEKTGSYQPSQSQTESDRFKIMMYIENMYYYACMEATSRGASVLSKNVFLDHACSLALYIKGLYPSLYFGKILPIVAACQNIDIYYLLEPHKGESQTYLIPNDIISSWWIEKKPCNCKDAMREIKRDLEVNAARYFADAGEPVPLVYSDRKKLIGAIDAARQQLNGTSQFRKLPDMVAEHYKELESHNTINGMGPVFPADLANWYASNMGQKLLQDELRYIADCMFHKLETSPQFDLPLYVSIIDTIGYSLHERTLSVLNPNVIKFSIAPVEKINDIKNFIGSTFLLSIPLTEGEASAYPIKNVIQRPTEPGDAIFNADGLNVMKHKRLLADAVGATDRSQVDPLVNALKSLKAKGTQLPEEVEKLLAQL